MRQRRSDRTALKRAASTVALIAVTFTLSACDPGPTKSEELAEPVQLSELCREAGGGYVLTIPPGYTSASYWCLWDEERDGGEW